MTFRIKYKGKPTDPIQESAKTVDHPTNGAKYKIVLDNVDFKYKIYDIAAGDMPPVKYGHGTSRHKVMIGVKNALEELGFKMEKEPRPNRKKGVSNA